MLGLKLIHVSKRAPRRVTTLVCSVDFFVHRSTNKDQLIKTRHPFMCHITQDPYHPKSPLYLIHNWLTGIWNYQWFIPVAPLVMDRYPTVESQSSVLFVHQTVTCNWFNEILSMLNIYCIYWKGPTKLNLDKKNDQNRTKTDRFTAFLEEIFGENGVTEQEQSPGFSIIRKIVFSS